MMSVETREASVEDRIKCLIVGTLDLQVEPGEIGTEDQLFGGDMGLNSMATIEMVVAIENDFDIEIPDEDLRVLFDTVKTMGDYIRRKKVVTKDGGEL
jgi:acyl carrier protein